MAGAIARYYRVIVCHFFCHNNFAFTFAQPLHLQKVSAAERCRIFKKDFYERKI